MKDGWAGLPSAGIRVIVRSSTQLVTSQLDPPNVFVIGPMVQSNGAVWAATCSGSQAASTTVDSLNRIRALPKVLRVVFANLDAMVKGRTAGCVRRAPVRLSSPALVATTMQGRRNNRYLDRSRILC